MPMEEPSDHDLPPSMDFWHTILSSHPSVCKPRDRWKKNTLPRLSLIRAGSPASPRVEVKAFSLHVLPPSKEEMAVRMEAATMLFGALLLTATLGSKAPPKFPRGATFTLANEAGRLGAC